MQLRMYESMLSDFISFVALEVHNRVMSHMFRHLAFLVFITLINNVFEA